MDEKILWKFLYCRTSPEEESAVLDWLGESDENKLMFKEIEAAFNSSLIYSPQEALSGKNILHRTWLRVAGVAAAVAIMLGSGYLFSQWRIDRACSKVVRIEAPAGQRVHAVLQDGSEVWLNGGSYIEYPGAFAGRSRQVRISGEVMFDVTHDAGKPFVVNTYAATVRVFGTKFNLVADEEDGVFSAALLSGKIHVVSNESADDCLYLEPGQCAELKSGRLEQSDIRDTDDFLWTDGIISLNSSSFSLMASKIERAYNIRIELVSSEPPVIKYRGKIRTVEGIEHTMKILLADTGYTYSADYENNVIYVK